MIKKKKKKQIKKKKKKKQIEKKQSPPRFEAGENRSQPPYTMRHANIAYHVGDQIYNV